jgi:hypothetical protein
MPRRKAPAVSALRSIVTSKIANSVALWVLQRHKGPETPLPHRLWLPLPRVLRATMHRPNNLNQVGHARCVKAKNGRGKSKF